MDIVLCHTCIGWVSPSDDRCPGCGDLLDLSQPDPEPIELTDRFGSLVEELGEVRLYRRELPDLGTLLLTEEGLLFLPHRVRTTDEVVFKRSKKESIGWHIASLIWAPLFFVGFIAMRKREETETREHFIPAMVAHDGRSDLGELFMLSPGSWFVPANKMRRLRHGWTKWTIESRAGRKIAFSPTDRKRFRVEALTGSDSGAMSWAE